ncbi:phosphoethanolamine transferase [Azohydromonas caseinilytica]|uniref:Phosphoethanolamine--lipid A transferase n=1 Tax=Azohydromonas caseinilytica TaxID=2728836 RepID=A0A848F2N9_9BURK|nr:phosphoethanolamine--lipid A transferase [Azohydromonas caseinilytica]NML14317.1 phosphoethanolamine--lipid A transferase [Azohydromonas caseinilytica]
MKSRVLFSSEIRNSRQAWSPQGLVVLTALWCAGPGNWPLWQRLMSLPELAGWRLPVLGLSMGLGIAGVLAALLAPLAWPRLVKPLLSLVLLCLAGAAHFIGSYGVVLDPTMMVNVLQTDAREVRDLLGLPLLLSFLLLALLPMAWLWRQPLARPGLPRGLLRNLALLVGGLALAAGLIYATFADFSSLMRNHTTLRYMISPINGWYSVARATTRSAAAQRNVPPAPVGRDAVLAARPQGAPPPLMVLVVGETARADHFALNGYGRPTNPGLSGLPVASFTDVTSCGTSTAASLPCMFSLLGREGFEAQRQPQENLLDVLQHAGLAVLWLDNQSGCKGLCDRVHNAMASDPVPGAPPLPPGLCKDNGECLDMAMLHGLDQRLAQLPAESRARGVVLVLHQMGSHGPAYHLRSPADGKPFQPECTNTALQHCDRQALVNAYDNSIVYTDRLLTALAAWLQHKTPAWTPALLYVSDHGESLGENNLYLHGLPYSVAPRAQKHVPLIAWWPKATEAATGHDLGCLRGRRQQPLSHDHLSHSVLGWLQVKTTEYRADLDVFAPCRRPMDATAH